MHDIYLILFLTEVAVDGAVYSSYCPQFVLSPVLLLEPPYECCDQRIQCGSGECFKRLWMISSGQKLPEAHNVPVSLSDCAISLLGFDESPVFFSLVRIIGGVVRVVRRVIILGVVGRVVCRVVVLRVVGRVVRRVVVLRVVGGVVCRVVVLRVLGRINLGRLLLVHCFILNPYIPRGVIPLRVVVRVVRVVLIFLVVGI